MLLARGEDERVLVAPTSYSIRGDLDRDLLAQETLFRA